MSYQVGMLVIMTRECTNSLMTSQMPTQKANPKYKNRLWSKFSDCNIERHKFKNSWLAQLSRRRAFDCTPRLAAHLNYAAYFNQFSFLLCFLLLQEWVIGYLGLAVTKAIIVWLAFMPNGRIMLIYLMSYSPTWPGTETPPL